MSLRQRASNGPIIVPDRLAVLIAGDFYVFCANDNPHYDYMHWSEFDNEKLKFSLDAITVLDCLCECGPHEVRRAE